VSEVPEKGTPEWYRARHERRLGRSATRLAARRRGGSSPAVRRERHDQRRACVEKVPYPTPEVAEEGRALMAERYGDSPRPFQVYACPWDPSHFHVGRKPKADGGREARERRGQVVGREDPAA
jgi:hypothetical protein